MVSADDPDCADPNDPTNNLCLIKAECIEGNCFDGFGTKRALNENLTYRGWWYEGAAIGVYAVEYNGKSYQAIYCNGSRSGGADHPWRCEPRGQIAQGFVRLPNGYFIGGFRGSWELKEPRPRISVPRGNEYIKIYEKGTTWGERAEQKSEVVIDGEYGVTRITGAEFESMLFEYGGHESIVSFEKYRKDDPDNPLAGVFVMDLKSGFVGNPEYMSATEAWEVLNSINDARHARMTAKHRSSLAWKLKKAFNPTKLARMTSGIGSAMQGVANSMPSVDQTFAASQRDINRIAAYKNAQRIAAEKQRIQAMPDSKVDRPIGVSASGRSGEEGSRQIAASPSNAGKKECIAQSESTGPKPNVPKRYCQYVFADYTDNASFGLDDYSSEFMKESHSKESAKETLAFELLQQAKKQCKSKGYSRVHHNETYEFNEVAVTVGQCKENNRMGSTFYLCGGTASFICAR